MVCGVGPKPSSVDDGWGTEVKGAPLAAARRVAAVHASRDHCTCSSVAFMGCQLSEKARQWVWKGVWMCVCVCGGGGQ